MTKISVVVPIYNVEKFLPQALDSIIKQTYSNLEIILVDDGSTDNSGLICEEYAKNDLRIKVIHKENGGLGSAYNTGIQSATGNYIAFVEPDDWIEENMYEVMLKKAIEYDCDVVKCGFYIYNSLADCTDVVAVKIPHVECCEPKEKFKIEDYPLLCAYHSSIWTYLYKADFVKQIKFNEVKGAGYVDCPFVFEVLCKASSILLIPDNFYHYRCENHGNSTVLADKSLLAMPERFIEAKEIIKKYNKYETLKEIFYLHASSANFPCFSRIEDNYFKKYFDKLKELFYDIKADDSFKFLYLKRYKVKIKAINNNCCSFFFFERLRKKFFKIRLSSKEISLTILGNKILFIKK